VRTINNLEFSFNSSALITINNEEIIAYKFMVNDYFDVGSIILNIKTLWRIKSNKVLDC